MNQLYLHVVIFKLRTKQLGAILTVLFFSMFFNILPSFAEENFEVTAHYYRLTSQTPIKYNDAIQWKITNPAQWNGFMDKLKTLPPAQDIGVSPLEMGFPDLIHFTQVNTDNITGTDVYLSKAGIQKVSRRPFDTYYNSNIEFRKFLDSEFKKQNVDIVGSGKIKTSDDGIVIVYRESSVLNNPTWQISSSTDLDTYKKYIDELVLIHDKETLARKKDQQTYDVAGSFVLYLNYAGAPFKFLSVTPYGELRGTTINIVADFYEDTQNYYSLFKAQAESSIIENENIRTGKTQNSF